MKTFKGILNELNEAKGRNYYEIGGDRYDGGVVLKVYINGKQVVDDIYDGEQEFRYKGKIVKGNIDNFLDVVGKKDNLKAKDFKRIELK